MLLFCIYTSTSSRAGSGLQDQHHRVGQRCLVPGGHGAAGFVPEPDEWNIVPASPTPLRNHLPVCLRPLLVELIAHSKSFSHLVTLKPPAPGDLSPGGHHRSPAGTSPQQSREHIPCPSLPGASLARGRQPGPAHVPHRGAGKPRPHLCQGGTPERAAARAGPGPHGGDGAGPGMEGDRRWRGTEPSRGDGAGPGTERGGAPGRG